MKTTGKRCGILAVLLLFLSIFSGCGKSEDKTIKLTFSPYDWKEEFTSTEEMETFSCVYREYYLCIIALYNHELEDHFQYGFDHYEEYQQSMDRLNSMKEMQREIHTAEEAELAAQMNVKAAQTHALIVRMNLSTETIKENMDSLREDIVHNNYEWISTGFE
ncbi:MAG: hypothetical protein ACI4LH_01900 [Candidatus Heritagella sp.]